MSNSRSACVFWSAITFVAGAGTMMLELSAPRLMQPYFGASVFVWTNVIGVLLLALAVGYALGGRLAARPHPARRIGWTLVGAGVWAILIPFVFPSLAEWLLPEASDLVQDSDGRGVMQLASLTVTVLLMAPAVVALATASPQIVSVMHNAGESVGKAAGRVYMMGTLGSLAGTFLPTYWLIPNLGTKATLITSGVFFVLGGVLSLAGAFNGRFGIRSICVVVLGAGILWGVTSSAVRPALAGEELLMEAETAYQYLRLTRGPAEGPGLGGAKEDFLRIDEGVVEYHSVAPVLGDEGMPSFIGSGGKYYDTFSLLPLLLPQKRQLSIAVLGSGAGTMARVLNEFMSDRVESLVNVELDPGVAELSKRLGWDESAASFAARTVIMDARIFSRQHTKDAFDIIMVDAYSRGTDIPFQMATVEFFTEVYGLLRAGGIVALNVSTPDTDAAIFRSLAATIDRAGFEQLSVVPIIGFPNVMLLARRGNGPLVFPSASSTLHAELRQSLANARRWLRNVQITGTDDLVLTDDLAPLEKLTDRLLSGERSVR